MSTKIVDLTHPLGRNTPMWPHPGEMPDVEIRRVNFPGRDMGRYTTVLTLKMHHGTHMDAEIHVTPGGWSIDQLPLTSCYGTGVVQAIQTALKAIRGLRGALPYRTQLARTDNRHWQNYR